MTIKLCHYLSVFFKKFTLLSLVLILLSIGFPQRTVAQEPEVIGIPLVQTLQLANIDALAFSNDEKLLASGASDGSLILWDTTTGIQISSFIGRAAGVTQVIFHPDGKRIISASNDNTIRVWDIQTGLELARLEDKDDVYGLAISEDGKTLVSAGENVRVWDINTGKQLHEMVLKKGVLNVAISPDGSKVASTRRFGKDNIQIWNASTGQALITLTGHTDAIRSIFFGNDNKTLISASDDLTIRIWDINSGKELHKLTEHQDMQEPPSLSLTSDRKVLLSSSYGGKMILWNISNGAKINTKIQRNKLLRETVISPSGNLIALTEDSKTYQRANIIRILDTKNNREICVMLNRLVKPSAIKYSNDGLTLFSVMQDGWARIWKTSNFQELRRFAIEEGSIIAAMSDDGKMLATSNSGSSLWLTNVANGQHIRQYEGSKDEVATSAIAFSPDGYLGASAGGDSAFQWDVETGYTNTYFNVHNDYIRTVQFSPNGCCLLTGSLDKTLVVSDLITGKVKFRLIGHVAGVFASAYSPDSKLIASGSADRSISIWDAATGKLRLEILGHDRAVTTLVFSKDGRNLFSASNDKTIRIWDVASGREINRLKGHEGDVKALSLSPNGKAIASASDDGTIRIWNVGSGKEILKYLVLQDNNWILITPEGYFKSSGTEAEKVLKVRTGAKLRDVSDIKSFRAKFYRPDLVDKVLSEIALP